MRTCYLSRVRCSMERSGMLRRRPGTFANAVFTAIPGLQRITACCAAPGKSRETR